MTDVRGVAGLNSTLVKRPAEAWPRVAGWLDDSNSTPLERMIVERAMRDDGINEVPLGSNRGIRIDAMTKRAGLKPPVWWCAIWVGTVFIDCGCLVPADYPATNAWKQYLVSTPRIGSAVLYGVGGVAHHIGIIARLSPLVLTVEGNRGYAGTTNNGQAVDLGPLKRSDIMGYIRPKVAA